MNRLRVVALREDRKRLLERLQWLGVVEIQTQEEPRAGFERPDTQQKVQLFERTAVTARQALKVLNEAAPVSRGLLDSFAGRRQVAPEGFEVIAERAPAVMQDCHRLLDWHKRRDEAAAEIVRLQTALSQLEPWAGLDISMRFAGTKTTVAFIGSLPAAYTQETLMSALAAQDPALTFAVEVVSSAREQTCLFALCPRAQEEAMGRALRSLGFARPPGVKNQLPKQRQQELRRRVEELERERAALKDQMVSLADRRRDIENTIDYYTVRADKYRAIGQLDHGRHVFVVEGFVPVPDAAALEEELHALCPVAVELTPADPGTAPVKLKNNKFVEPAESITAMYAMPSVYDVDPTPVMSIFFYFFFGMMFSDVGYGLLLILGAGWLIKRYQPETAMRRNLKLFQLCGVFTAFWGVIYGGYFGDLPTVIANTFFGVDFTIPALLNPIDDAVTILVMSMGFGLIQILAGMGVKLYMQWRTGDHWGACFDSGLWMTTLIGAALLAGGVAGVPGLTTAGAVVMVASLAGLVLTQGRKKKGIMKVVSGVASLYDITGYVSDLMSYSRLLALGLTTGVMGMVFNLLGAMFGNSLGGVLAMIVIGTIGHALNFALNALGSYVHTIRLQYVEMFGKFYEGGGRPFRPFALRSQYIRIKEDT